MVPYWMLVTVVNLDAIAGAEEIARGRPYELSWFSALHPETGERTTVRAQQPGKSEMIHASV